MTAVRVAEMEADECARGRWQIVLEGRAVSRSNEQRALRRLMAAYDAHASSAYSVSLQVCGDLQIGDMQTAGDEPERVWSRWRPILSSPCRHFWCLMPGFCLVVQTGGAGETECGGRR